MKLNWVLANLLMIIGSVVAFTQKQEIFNHLKRLNKAPLKSIQSLDGDVIDCVRSTDQPAFDHPLLKNHTLQVAPKYRPQFGDLNERKVVSKFRQAWHANGRCPKGSVPIRRTKESDVLRGTSVKQFAKKIHHPMFLQNDMSEPNNHEHAIAFVKGEKYHGTRASLNVWKPQVRPLEFSLAQLWLLAGPPNDRSHNSVEAGWHVNPVLYGDYNPRLFIYWTADGYQNTGCYNLNCPGFIQTNKDIPLGATIQPYSTYNASQFEITLFIWKEPSQGNWWLQFGDEQPIGYWPKSLFGELADSATGIQWGGEITNMGEKGEEHTTTQMGSGHFAEERYGKASYFKDLQVINETGYMGQPTGIQTFTYQNNCYNIKLARDGREWGDYFFYGGPGRNPNCLLS